MNDVTAMRIAKAIAQQGSAEYTTPSGPTLDLMSELLAEGNLVDTARAFLVFSNVHPANARLVARWMPAKISNHYFFRQRNLNVGDFERWSRETPNWAEIAVSKLRTPEAFATVIEAMADEIENR